MRLIKRGLVHPGACGAFIVLPVKVTRRRG
jgi:hypothetical protein